MTKKQYREARAILAKDCKIALRYCDGKGNTCAIGALALAAGYSQATLRNFSTKLVTLLPALVKRIEERFGLTEFELASIQDANDEEYAVKIRRKMVLETLKAFAP